ncbi:MAG: hypothetical protein ACKVT1_14725 [Dehalococcoidia bacterium]
MAILDWLVSFAFGGLYGAVIIGIALIGALPYGAWQGVKRIRARFRGGEHGHG